MEDFSTILWILVIAAASLLSQGRKARSGKTSRKPGPATDDTAPHPTPTTRPEWPGIPGFPKIPGFPEGGMHDGETRKAAAESAPEAPARRVVSGPESREKPFSKPKTTERAPGTDQPETRETTVFPADAASARKRRDESAQKRQVAEQRRIPTVQPAPETVFGLPATGRTASATIMQGSIGSDDSPCVANRTEEEPAAGIAADFDLRRAVIYVEILKPKFEE